MTLDRLKDAGFHWATRSGVTIAIDDVVVPPRKQEILDGYETRAEQVNKRYQRGALSYQERNDEMVQASGPRPPRRWRGRWRTTSPPTTPIPDDRRRRARPAT